MKKTLLGILSTFVLLACNNSQNSDAQLDLESLNDSTTIYNEDGTVSNDFQPYGKAKAQELALARKNEIEAILEMRGVTSTKVSPLSRVLQKELAFNEWDVVEEGEFVQEGNIILTSLIFGPFDGNGRGYSVLGISDNKLYLSADHWENTAIDSAYNIQMAADKKISFVDGNLQIVSPSKGNLLLKLVSDGL